MWTMGMVALAAAGQLDDDVARGWYLWQTGQSEAAYEVADAIGIDGASGAAWPFVVGMAVDRGQGPSIESELRDRWSEDRDAPQARIGLAWALSLRRVDEGSWCEEVVTLLKPVVEGMDRYWAAQANMERERRCVGSTEHGEAELRRIAKAGDGPAADAAFGSLRAGYFKDGFPKQLEAALEEMPHRVAEAGVAWSAKASGPTVAGTRKVLSQALEAAAESDDPSLVYAAMLGYRGAEKGKPEEDARARLASLDPGADPDNPRTLVDIADPEPLGAIDECTETATSMADGIACLRGVDTPERGSIAGYKQFLLRVLLQQTGDADGAFQAAKASWQADPTHRLYAAVFAQMALERGEELELAEKAAAAVLDGRLPEDPSTIPEPLRKRRASALDVWAGLEARTGKEKEGLEHMLLAVALNDVPVRRHRLGHALAAAGRTDDAVMVLLRALKQPVDDTALVGSSRALLAEHLGDWHPAGLTGALAELDGKPPEPHPLVGQALPEGVLPASFATSEAPREAVVIGLWDGTSEASQSALTRWKGIGERYAAQAVALLAVDVGMQAGTMPEEVTLEGFVGSSSTLRALRLVSVPSVVVVDGKGIVRAVLSGYDAGGLDLEKALDAFLPEAAE